MTTSSFFANAANLTSSDEDWDKIPHIERREYRFFEFVEAARAKAE